MTKQTITKTEIQSIEAKDLLTRFDNLESRLSELQQTVKPQPKTILLTRMQVAEMLDISLVTLHSWIKKGVLNAYRIGNKVRFKEREVLEALQRINSKND